ncbi:hypothetical protein [Protofrankia symbiont of Coriaria ruscifolia]|uniref:Uncharacterized protein n=1 Tax=Candidatus Protofrankia californiensis TaxID=1839754 RepID=A0A1C3NSQ3_9ACTN|nr:hypothetical protein [Protofrankia symbiont of Coriaria ruscifolia]SBW16989.1 hypothetical protein FDG2_0016 [Candidatus Protofrankia californiensis]
MHHYHELEIPGRFDPLALVAALSDSDLFSSHVVYERDNQWWFAGAVFGEVVVEPTVVRSSCQGRQTAVERSPHPLRQVGDLLATFPLADWHAYGWVCFEFAYALAGGPRVAEGRPLLHVMVPRTEIWLRTDHVLIRGTDDLVIGSVRDLITGFA